MSENLLVERLTKESCEKNLDDFIAVSSDVSDWGREQFLCELPKKWELSLSVWGDKPIAYVILSKKWSDRIHIHQFMVKKEYRGSGIGGMLMDALLKKYSNEDISLKVHEDNREAIRFYEGRGFFIQEASGEYNWMYFARRKTASL